MTLLTGGELVHKVCMGDFVDKMPSLADKEGGEFVSEQGWSYFWAPVG